MPEEKVNMKTIKYFDYKRNRPIDLNKDGCDLGDWKELYKKASFAKHPRGFLVFLSPEELQACDEYKESDPYAIKETIETDFHKRRVECTLELIKEANNNIKGVPRVLDLGCGQGHITCEIRQMFPDAEISGLDYSVSAIEYAVDHFSGIDFAAGDACECPYAKNYFDIVVCNNLWEHVPDPVFLLSRITGILKPGGFVVISTPSRYRLGNLARVIRGKTVALMSKHHVTEYSVGQVIEQLRYGGYQVDRILSKSIKRGILKSAIKALFSVLISLVKSHHRLEFTVFYLARQTNNKNVNNVASRDFVWQR